LVLIQSTIHRKTKKIINQTHMTQIITLILGIIIGYTIAKYQKGSQPKKQKLNQKAQERKEQREENLQKVVEYLNEKGRASNNDVEKLLGVADSTASTYLQELEESGTIRQIGKEGRSVKYILR